MCKGPGRARKHEGFRSKCPRLFSLSLLTAPVLLLKLTNVTYGEGNGNLLQYSCLETPMDRWSMGSLRVGHDWANLLSLFTFIHWRRKWQPTPVFLHGESQGRGAWWAAVYGVAQSHIWLKRLSSSSSLWHILTTKWWDKKFWAGLGNELVGSVSKNQK